MKNAYKSFMKDVSRQSIGIGAALFPWSIKGFREEEVVRVEEWLGHALPLAYRAFLLEMGRSAGKLFGDVGMTFSGPSDLIELRTGAEEHWANLGFSSILTSEHFCFHVMEGPSSLLLNVMGKKIRLRSIMKRDSSIRRSSKDDSQTSSDPL